MENQQQPESGQENKEKSILNRYIPFSIPIVFLVLFIAVVYVESQIRLVQDVSSISNPALKENIESSSPIPTKSGFKTYTNKKYNFELAYPSTGLVPKEKENDFAEQECGNAIKENEDGILADNFFQIKIIPWQGTIDSYLIQKGAKNKYDFKEILNSNADEAIEVTGIKKGLELSSVGYPPLMYISNIYKKDNNLFITMHKTHPPEPINPNGCLNPKDIDHTKYPQYTNHPWDITTSFKFLTPPKPTAVLSQYCSKVDRNPPELTFEASYCNGDSCSIEKTKTKCESTDVIKIVNGKIVSGQDGKSDCSWTNNSCLPNK